MALGSAAASCNAEVHNLLAQRIIASMNNDTAAIDAIDARLAELGLAV